MNEEMTIMDTIEAAVALEGFEVLGGNTDSELLIMGSEENGCNYRLTVEKIPK